MHYFTKGTNNNDGSEDNDDDWYKLIIRRSKWYDLLLPADRVELARGIWAVLGFTLRNLGEQGLEPEAMVVEKGEENEK